MAPPADFKKKEHHRSKTKRFKESGEILAEAMVKTLDGLSL